MINRNIIWPRIKMRGQRQETCMFARTVIVAPAGRLACTDQPIAGGNVRRLLWAAAKCGVIQPKMRKPGSHPRCMNIRALMGGAGQSQMLRTQPIRARRAAFNQGQPLQHFAGGARINQQLRIAPSLENIPGSIADHGMTQMPGFQHLPPPDFDHRFRLCHSAHPLVAKIRLWAFPNRLILRYSLLIDKSSGLARSIRGRNDPLGEQEADTAGAV